MNKYCTNCGNAIPADATRCPVCGHPVTPVSTPSDDETAIDMQPGTPVSQPQVAPPVSNPEPIVEPKSGPKAGVIFGVILLLLVLGVGGYFGWNMYCERQLWSQISQSAEIADYENYLDRFPYGAHRTQAQVRYEDLKRTRDKWLALEAEGNFDLYRGFVRAYPESAYRELALQRMDSIAWAEALRADSPAGYREYLERMPNGEYTDEAAAKVENMEMRALSPIEEDKVTDLISSFFSAAEYDNIDGAIALFPAEFKFMGRDANKVHIIKYIRSLHDEGASMVSVTPTNYVVKKDVDENRNVTYAITFNLDVRKIYDGDAPDVFTSYTGNAVIDSNDMITSLALHKVASM